KKVAARHFAFAFWIARASRVVGSASNVKSAPALAGTIKPGRRPGFVFGAVYNFLYRLNLRRKALGGVARDPKNIRSISSALVRKNSAKTVFISSFMNPSAPGALLLCMR